MQPTRVAVYAGTFDPVTFGHLDVITKAAALVDVLHVLVAVNPQKTTWFSSKSVGRCCARCVRVLVDSTQGMVVDFARSVGATWLIRGVRTTTDAAAELELATLNANLAPPVTTLFVNADPKLSLVSSSGLKALATSGGSLANVCPPLVAQRPPTTAERPTSSTVRAERDAACLLSSPRQPSP